MCRYIWIQVQGVDKNLQKLRALSFKAYLNFSRSMVHFIHVISLLFSVEKMSGMTMPLSHYKA